MEQKKSDCGWDDERIRGSRDEAEEASPRIAREYHLQFASMTEVRTKKYWELRINERYREEILGIFDLGAEAAALRVHHRHIRYKQYKMQ